jgi:hypothetical protein
VAPYYCNIKLLYEEGLEVENGGEREGGIMLTSNIPAQCPDRCGTALYITIGQSLETCTSYAYSETKGGIKCGEPGCMLNIPIHVYAETSSGLKCGEPGCMLNIPIHVYAETSSGLKCGESEFMLVLPIHIYAETRGGIEYGESCPGTTNGRLAL